MTDVLRKHKPSYFLNSPRELEPEKLCGGFMDYLVLKSLVHFNIPL